MNRRDFIKLTGALGIGFIAAGWLDDCRRLSSFFASSLPYGLPEWTGDSFAPMHLIRDGKVPHAPKPSQKVDLVIVGGGLSGLTAAYYLRNENFLLLERENILGGNAKQGEYGGISYALGSAYIVDTGEPFGSLYSDLGISVKPVESPVDTGYENKTFSQIEAGKAAKSFQKLRAYFKVLLKGKDFPVTPIQKASSEARKLDQISFYDFLKNSYSNELVKYIDAYCYSALGGGVKNTSAYAGVNFYSEIAADIYAFPGGNAYVAGRLAEKIGQAGSNRIQTGVSVYRIAQDGDRVLVTYFRNSDLRPFTVESKAAIIAIPYFFAGRILESWPENQRKTMTSFQYGSYLVANLCFNKEIFQGGYDNWTPDNPVFTDFIDAGYVSNGKAKPLHGNSPFVLTVYAPFRNPVQGRYALFQGDKRSFAEGIFKALSRFVDFREENLKEIRLTRYGHQLLASRTGIIRTLLKLKKQSGRIVLSHSDGQGMAAIESAISEALFAAKQVKKLLANKSAAIAS